MIEGVSTTVGGISFVAFFIKASVSANPFIKDPGMSYVALAFAVIMPVRCKSTVDRFYQALDWDLLAFFGLCLCFDGPQLNSLFAKSDQRNFFYHSIQPAAGAFFVIPGTA